jgi:hypothetical protein
MTSPVVVRLTDLFKSLNYRWKIGGELRTPTEDDLEKTLDIAKQKLYDQPIDSQLQVGQLLVKRYAKDKFDVYLRMGEI